MKNSSDVIKIFIFGGFLLFAGIAGFGLSSAQNTSTKDGPANQGTRAPRQDGDAAAGRDVFRFETFGNEGFWTDAARVPQGVVAAKLTPLKALQVGLSVDVDALDAATQQAVAKELQADPTGAKSKLFNDPATTLKLLNANAVIGLVVKDSNGDGKLDVAKGDKVGISCAICHTITDVAILSVPSGGSIGHRQDGLTNHNLNVGAVLATAANSRAFYPVLQLSLSANGGKKLCLTIQNGYKILASLSGRAQNPVGPSELLGKAIRKRGDFRQAG